MDPGIKKDISPLKTHLRRIPGREVLHMHRRRNNRARHAGTFGNMALHLRTEHQLWLQFNDALLDLQVVIADQGLHVVQLGGLAHLARKLAAVGADANHLEAKFLACHAGSSHCMGGITKHKNSFPGEVGRVNRAGIPSGTRSGGGEQHAGV